MNEEELSFLVRDYPNLYDQTHQHYHDNFVINNSWEEIGSALGCSGDECKAKWKSMLKRNRKALQKKIQAAKQMKACPLESHREYARPVISDQRDRIIKSEPLSNDEMEDDLPQRSMPQPLMSENLEPSQRRIGKRKLKVTPTTAIFKQYCDKKEERNTDHIAKFFQSIEETVRTFPPHLQVKIKSQFSSIVHNAEYEVIASSQNSILSFPSTSSVTPPSTISSFPGGPNPISQLSETFHAVLPPNVSTYTQIPPPNNQINSTNSSATSHQPPSSDQQASFV